jgi:hypothetical protein
MDYSPLRVSASSSLRASNVFASSEGGNVTVMVPSKLQQPWSRSVPNSARKNAHGSASKGKRAGATPRKAPLPSSLIGGRGGDAPAAVIAELRSANAVLGTELHRSHLVKEKEKVRVIVV